MLAALSLFFAACVCGAQTAPEDISPARLETIIGLPLDQAVKQREIYKAPLKAAVAREKGPAENECAAEFNAQQPYNICMGQASEHADQDHAIFYNNLQMLCHDRAQLTTLQASEHVWRSYRDSAMKATRAAWPDGTAAPGVAGQVYLQLIRDRMRELETIYGMNIAQ